MREFEKHNSTTYPDALLKEANGLRLLARALGQTARQLIRVPAIHAVDQYTLRLTAIDSRSATPTQMERLGEGLADLHRVAASYYGLDEDNYIGLAPQPNGISDDWGSFFVERRLGFQIGRIANARRKAVFRHCLNSCRGRLVEFLNASCQRPSLVHGDLWSGNVLFDADSVWLIDPAVYYGDREVDLAMSEMFGGFSQAFYCAYDRVYPRSADYPLKREIYNLYHYLNHLILFGSSYLDGCERGLAALERL